MKLNFVHATVATFAIVLPYVIGVVQGHDVASSPGSIPPPEPVSVGLADTCDATRICRDGLVCGSIPGRPEDICLRLKGPREECTIEYEPCIPGYRCVVPEGQYRGFCRRIRRSH
jgi:hypothetical protein